MITTVWVAAIVLMWVVVWLVKLWRSTSSIKYLYASYAVGYGSIGILLLVLWLGGKTPWDHWFSIVGLIYLVVSAPWMMLLHRREVRRYERTS